MRYLPVEVQRNLVLSVGTHRRTRPLSPIEVGIAVDYEINQGTSSTELAGDLLLKDTSILQKFRNLARLTPELHHLVDWGASPATISMSSAAEIARLKTSADQNLLADSLLENRITWKEILQIVELSSKQIASLPAVIEQILNARPKLVHQHIFIGAVSRLEMSELLAAMTQQQRDTILAKVLANVLPKGISAKGRLGSSRFDIVGGEDLAKLLGQLPQGFENLFNQQIASEIET